MVQDATRRPPLRFPRPLRLAVFVAACGVIAWLSLEPTTALPSVSLSDKIEHLIAYFGLAVIGLTPFPARPDVWPSACSWAGSASRSCRA